MASLGDLTVELDLDTNDFTRNMDRMRSRMNNLGNSVRGGSTRSFSSFGNVLGSVGGRMGSLSSMLAGGLATGGALLAVEALTKAFGMLKDAISNVVTEGIKYNASMEANTIAFEVMLGSAKEAEKMMMNLSKFAETTPFETEGLVQSAKQMKAFGIATDDIMPNLKMLGDIALGDSQKLKSLTLAFAQIQSTGKLMGQDLLQLVNVGFNPLQVISEETGKTMGELKDIMSNGGISADLVALAFKRATSEGGTFYKGMDKLGQSFDGRMSTLADTMSIIKGKLTKPFFDFLSSNVLPKIQGLLDNFSKSIPAMMKGISTFYNQYLSPVYDVWISAFKDIWGEGMKTRKIVMQAFKDIWSIAKPVIDMMYTLWITRISQMAEVVRTVFIAIHKLYQIVYESFSLIKNIITGNWDQAFKNIENITKNFKDFFLTIFKGIGRFIFRFAEGFVKIWDNLGVNIKQVFINIFQWIVDKYDAFITKINELGTITLGGGEIFGKEIPSYTLGIPEMPTLDLDVANEFAYAEGVIKNWLGLTNAIEENTAGLEVNASMSKAGVNWAEMFGKELGFTEENAKSLNKTMDKLTDTIQKQGLAFANFVGIFDKVTRVRMSATSIFRRMEGQVMQMRRWREALANVGERIGTGSLLYQELAKQGPQSAGQIKAIAGMSDEQLAEYKALFGEKVGIGTEVAGIAEAGKMGVTNNIEINITGNNINDSMDLDIIANRLAKELIVNGVS